MAKTIGRNMNDVEKYIESKIIAWLTKVGQQLPIYLKEFIQSEYYDQYAPSPLYDRKFRIMEAIMVTSIKKIGNTYTMSIYLDPSAVSYDPSVWYDKRSGSWNYIKGDTSEDVFNLMANGIHGSIDNGQTDGRFWEEFLDSVGAGGIYDLFEDFKRYLGKNGVLSISR
jgi:hypothetical protein